jgi:DNA-binding NtrC family response regulator
LEQTRFNAIEVDSVHNLEQLLKDTKCRAIFWDIDTVPAENRIIRNLNEKFPGVFFFCLSGQPIHPELKDAISQHIYACLSRPIDTDELFFWLRSIEENNTHTGKPETNPLFKEL